MSIDTVVGDSVSVGNESVFRGLLWRYTTNIELTGEDRIRLCSPTIANTKLNGGVVQHHHLWRHAPESLIRMITSTESAVK